MTATANTPDPRERVGRQPRGFLAATGGGAVAVRGTERVDSGAIRDGEARARSPVGSEPGRVVGGRAEPRLLDGGNGDCKWKSLAPELRFNPPLFHRVALGVVHLADVLQVEVLLVPTSKAGARPVPIACHFSLGRGARQTVQVAR